MSILSRLRSLFLFAIISFALFVIACKKESSPTPPPPPEKSKVTVSSFQVDDNSKIFLPPFSGKVSGEIYVALIPQTGGAFTGDIILKIVNAGPVNTVATVDLSGFGALDSKASLDIMSGVPENQNTLQNPRHIIPVNSSIIIGKDLSYDVPAYSLSVIRIKSKK